MDYKVFLSYSTKDMGLVVKIRDDLTKAGISVYLAEERPEPGKTLSQKIMENIKSSDCMIVLLTDIGIRSQYVNQEIGAARMIDKPVIPMVEKKMESKIGGLLAGIEYILFDKANPRKAMEKVVSYVSRLKLSLEIEIRKREELYTIITISALIVMIAIILYFAFRRR